MKSDTKREGRERGEEWRQRAEEGRQQAEEDLQYWIEYCSRGEG
jgi:hypothetical protein